MADCKLRGQFKYIKYDGTNKLEIYNIISKYGYTKMEIQGKADWVVYADIDLNLKTFNSDVQIITPGEYVVMLDENTLAHYSDVTFHNTFFDVEKGEEYFPLAEENTETA